MMPQPSFDHKEHIMTKSADGSFTAYSKRFDEHYHSTTDGAMSETLHKHVIPAFERSKHKKELHILDICFGLGLNTLATIKHYQKHAPQTKLFIYSPEFDAKLIRSLPSFEYPKNFHSLHPLIKTLSYKHRHEDDNVNVELFLGDAREYVKKFSNRFDIVYQDAFSPQKNPKLWTLEYFKDLKNAMKEDGVLTTYSTALTTRLALHQNGFYIYLLHHKTLRNSTLASFQPLGRIEKVDMKHKLACNPDAKPLCDAEIS